MTKRYALGLGMLGILLFMSGCLADENQQSDMPWSRPASWEGTMPLPPSMQQYND